MKHKVIKKTNIQSVPLRTDVYIPDVYTAKIAYLVSLTEQIKRYGLPQLNHWLEIEKLEMILDQPGIADRDWTKENLAYQQGLLDFLNIHISVYEKALMLLKEKINRQTT